jgi:glyoxylase-like metal-dependent hydrolase (beta-lactamase superfamily II)
MIERLGTEFVSFYAVQERSAVTLVDAGLPHYAGLLAPGLARLGRASSDVRAVVLTHTDPDHLGFVAQIQARAQVPVFVHRADADRAQSGAASR